jgi:CARDB
MGINRVSLCAALLLFFIFFTNLQIGLSKNKKLPDLTVSKLNADTSTTAGGHLQNALAEILNRGKRPAGSFRVRFYLSADTNITTDDIDTGSGCEIAGLGRGESAQCGKDVDVPASVTPGLYYLGAIIDDPNAVVEKDESNNFKAFGPVMINKPDEGPPPPPLPPGTIQVDGDPGDWAGIHPTLTDGAGDGPFDASNQYHAGSDIVKIFVTNDNSHVFFLMEFAGAPYTGDINLSLDTDVNPLTGCKGMEAVIHTSTSESGAHLALAVYENCILSADIPGAILSAVREREGHSFVEASIKIEDLFRVTPGRIDFRFYAIADAGGTPDYIFPATVYSLTSRYAGGANLRIEFDSETILPDFSRPCGTTLPGWVFGMTLTETEGVGVTITSYKTVLYDANGGYLYTIGSKSGTIFGRLFSDCGTGSNYIGPSGKACGRSLCLDSVGRSGGQIDITFSGTDDKGNQVRFTSGRLVLLSR